MGRQRSDSDTSEELLRFLDLVIDASASMFDVDPELASFAMMAVVVVAERLGIPDETAYQLRNAAVAEIRKRREVV